jgi:DNA (cytosine-5)-methyltransferase 1
MQPPRELVLSLFPGVDLLGRGFESLGFCVVRGPDLIWDSRIEDFRSIPGRFDGIIGGPPCQNYSDANRTRNTAEGDRLVLEFLRAIEESRPRWFLIENVRNVPTVAIDGYHVQRLDLTDCECGGRQKRLRHIQFGSDDGSIIRPIRTNGRRPVTPVVMCRTAGKHDRHSRRLHRQGAPLLPLRALTPAAKSRAIGNAVPWQMAVTLARAVTERGPVTPLDCRCGCGRVTETVRFATAACRKRMERRRRGHVRTVTLADNRG